MASTFTITLKTTGPATPTIALAGGAAFTAAQAVTATIGMADTLDGHQMKLWGTVDPAADPNIQVLEVNSAWITYATSKSVTLSTGDGVKTVNLKIRDKVGNESATSDTITFDATAPVTTVGTPDVSTISKIAGFRTAANTFSPDVALVAYKVKVVPSTGSLENAGTQIPTTNGSTNMSGGAVSAGATVSITIDGRDLELASSGDGAKIIKVFGQEASGNWSV